MEAITSLLPGLASSALVSWWSRATPCQCHCAVDLGNFPEPSKLVVDLLRSQLERCGPEHLTIPRCPNCECWGSHATLLCAGALVAAVGFLAGYLWAGFRRRATVAPAVSAVHAEDTRYDQRPPSAAVVATPDSLGRTRRPPGHLIISA